MEKQKPKNARGQAVKPPPAAKTPPPGAHTSASLFRKIDWLALVITFAVIWIVFFLTLAPEQTLEDSGELCTGSFYAGISPSAGLSLLGDLFLALDETAGGWKRRVARGSGQATAAALAAAWWPSWFHEAAAMLMEGIEDLRNMTGNGKASSAWFQELSPACCLASGASWWSESVVIIEISPSVCRGCDVLLCLLEVDLRSAQRGTSIAPCSFLESA